MSEKIAIIDLGSNSVRLVLMEVYLEGGFKLIDQLKYTPRLSEKMGPDRVLRNEAMDRTINTIRLFKRHCEINGVDRIIAVATAAVRLAKNREEFLAKLYQATGIHFRVLSEEEEAYYGYLGVVNSTDLMNGYIMDIGGGSTEITLFENRRTVKSVSLPFGAVVLTEQFLDSSLPTPEQLANLEAYLIETFASIPWLKNIRDYPLIGVGGTIRNVAKIYQHIKNYSFRKVHYQKLTAHDVCLIYNIVSNLSLKERKKIPGLSKERADIFIAGVAVLNHFLNYTRTTNLIISGNGIREGLFFYDILSRTGQDLLENPLCYSVDNAIKYYHLNKRHAHQVAKLSCTLFDKLAPIHGLGERERRLLEAAALLHDCGIAINFYQHYRHSLYVICNSQLYGVDHQELLIIAFVAANHSGKVIKKEIEEYSDILGPREKEIILKLTPLIQIAEGLDLSKSDAGKDIDCEIKDDLVKILVKVSHEARPELEILHTMQRAAKFEKIYHRKLVIQEQEG